MGQASSKTVLADIANLLVTKEIDPADHVFWDELWKITNLTSEQLFLIVNLKLIRKMIVERPHNIRTLFTQAVAQLYQVVETPYPIYYGQALQCARMLARVMPSMIQANSKTINELFWSKQNFLKNLGDVNDIHKVPVTQSAVNLEESKEAEEKSSSSEPVVTSKSAEIDSVEVGVDTIATISPPPTATPSTTITATANEKPPSSVGNTPERKKQSGGPTVSPPRKKVPPIESSVADSSVSEPLAVILVNSLFHLMFLPEFTIEHPHQEFNERDLNSAAFRAALMWSPGVWSNIAAVPAWSSRFDLNRIDILRVLIACLSDSLYQSPESFDPCGSYWLEVATSSDVPYADIVFSSLINTVLGYDPVGWGVPYTNLLAADTSKLLMETSAQVLITLLDYGYPVRWSPPSDATDSAFHSSIPSVGPDETESRGFNVFRRILGRVDDSVSLTFMFNGFSRLLNNLPQSDGSFLPYSIPRVEIAQELLLLLWKCIEECPAFVPHVFRECDVTELLLPICYLMLSGRRDGSQTGLVYICTFLLLRLSGERTFSVSLNKQYNQRALADLPVFVGSYSDLIIITLHKMIVSGSEKITSLYNCFLTIIANISPYCKSLCSVSAVKIVSLFHLFTSPRFLYSAEGNHVYVSLLLETMNNIVQYQYEGNVSLIYSILKRKEIFEALAKLSLPAAIREANNQQSRDHSHDTPAVTEKRKSSGIFGAGKSKSNIKEEEGSLASPPIQSTGLVNTHNVIHASGVEKSVEIPVSLPLVPTSSTGDIGSTTVASAPNSTSTPVIAKEENSPVTVPSGNLNTADVVASQKEMTSGQPSPPIGATVDTDAITQKLAIHHPAVVPARLRWLPTEEWLTAVKAELPLLTIMRLLRYLGPLVEDFAKNSSIDELQVMELIRKTTMVGLLPVPHPIVIRKYQANRYTSLWFTAYQWSTIFMYSSRTLPLFEGKAVRLFTVQGAVV